MNRLDELFYRDIHELLRLGLLTKEEEWKLATIKENPKIYNASDVPRITKEEEMRIAKIGEKELRRVCIEKLVNHNIRYVFGFSKVISLLYPNVDLKDVFQQAYIDAWKAAERFSPDYKTKFITFMSKYLIMTKYNILADRLPVHMPSHVPYFVWSGKNEDEVLRSMVNSEKHPDLAIDWMRYSEQTYEVEDDKSDGLEETTVIIESIINSPDKFGLEDIEIRVIIEYFGLGKGWDKRKNLRELAKELNVSHETIRNIRERAIKKIKSQLKWEYIEENYKL